MNSELEFDLCAAVAEVLHKHGLHNPGSEDESLGWTPVMAAEFCAFMKGQIRRFETEKG